MKRTILFMLLSLAFVFSVGSVEKSDYVATSQIIMEHKEAYKLDDGEYKNAVSTKTSFGSESSEAGLGIVGLLFVLTGIVRRNKEGIGLAVLFIAGNFMFGNASELSLAVLPLIPFMRSPDVETISGTEVKKLLAEMGTKHSEAITDVTKKITEAVKGFMTVDVLKNELGTLGLKADEIKALSDAVVEQGKVLKELKDKANKVAEGKDLGEMVYDQGEALKKLADGNKDARHTFKINKTIVQRSSLASSTLGYRVPGIGQLPTRKTIMRSLFNNVSLSANDVKESNGVIRYIDQAAITRGATAVAELAGRTVGTGNKPESAISWIERSLTLETLADTIPVTKQSYRNLGFVAGEIDKMLRVNLALLEDTQLYSGDGNTPNLAGVYTTAPAVVLASLPQFAQVEGANLYDLIAALKVYIMNGSAATGKQSKYLPNVVVMNPADILKYKLLKAVNGHYLLPPFISADGSTIDGIKVVEDSVVTVNTLVIGDFDYGTVYHEEEITIDMGLVNDQFLKNQWTIRAEQVEALLIRNVDADAFLKVADINAAIVALEKV